MVFSLKDLQGGFHVGECLVEPRKNRIVRANAEAHVEPRVMDVLVCLAMRAGEVVSRDALNEQVWRDVVVTDQAVTNCISELRNRLGDDRSANRLIETIPKRGYRLLAPVRLARAESTGKAPPRSRGRLVAVGLPVLVCVLAGVAWWRASTLPPALTSVAVVRFANAAGDESLDYLGLALPDEIATLLTQSRDLAVRPLGYVDADDPLAAARARRVDHIVTGRYYREDDRQLSLAVEAQRVAEERVLWRTRITVPAGDLLAMRREIAAAVQRGLLPALGARAAMTPGSAPAQDEAYQLYLRSLALPQQPNPSARAIEMLERSVAIEPGYAPAWNVLGLRYYDVGTWWEGGETAREKSLAAHRRALELDPGMIPAAQSIVTRRAEAGDLEGAYRDARALLEQFGPSAETHFTLSYVYRYGGMLEEAQRHCELARDRDPQNPRLRSCAYAYLYAGKLGRVMEFLMLDEGSYFADWGTVLYYLRLDDRESALNVARQAAEEPTRGLMQPCLEGMQGAALDAPVAEFLRVWERGPDPESYYAVAPMLYVCGRPLEALRLVERGVDLNFCAYPALDQDPVWSGLRGDPEFQRIRAKATACHERFRRTVEADEASPSR